MRTLSIDIETYSSVDLAEAGVYRYAEAPDFEVLLFGYSIDGGPVQVLDLLEDRSGLVLDATEVGRWLQDPRILKTAWNAQFERTCLAKFYGVELPPEQWSDTMVLALEMGLPGSLADAGTALGLPEDQLKDPIGKSLIRYFSKPCEPTRANGGRTRNLPQHDPEKWELYKSYNRQDVVTEMAIRSKLLPLAESERRLWRLDQRLNDHGVRVDLDMVRKIVRFDEQNRQRLEEKAKNITKLANPNSLVQLKGWLADHGVEVSQLRKDDLDRLLQQELPGAVHEVLRIRQALGKTSVKKYGAMLAATCADGRLRGILQFYGANRSGRWAGRLVQTHNLARNTLPDLDLARELAAAGDFETLEALFGETSFVFSELIRTAFVPSEGCRFVVSDFSAIEARVIAWLAGEEWVLQAFREGKDIYCETASMMYHVPVVKHGENAHLRQKGKVAVLACGYQGGVGAMRAMDRGGTIPDEELQSVVDQWRQANPRIVKLWRTYEAAARTAIEERRTVRLRCGVAYSYENGNLFAKLPNGRRLCYWQARLKEDAKGLRIYYMGVNQETKRWGEAETYGGKLVENVVQATARDCLAEAMQRVTSMGYQIVMHVHDEMIVDAPADDTEALARINAAMSDPIPWAPGLPLKGDGYTCDFYKKD